MSERIVLSGRFEVGELLGQGGMGAVFHGVDLATRTPVAIKVLKPEVVAQSPDQVERFRREAEALRQLDHSNIVKVLDAAQDGADYYIVMEYMGGGSLGSLMKRVKPLSILFIANTALDLSDALTRAHRLKIYHRDLKPDNVLLSSEGIPKLTDFGVAHITGAGTLTRPGQVIGTLHFMAPEILNGHPADARTDIWAFGVMLYEMVSGFKPFMGAKTAEIITAIIKQPVPALQKLRPDCPQELAQLVHAMLEKDPSARISTVREIGYYLEQLLTTLES